MILRPGRQGPSPRARGIHTNGQGDVRPARSIPASAGNPARWRRLSWPPTVHPRERGESAARVASSGAFAGPSPRARGILRSRSRAIAGSGSIPASAGNPRQGEPRPIRYGVHPRERGESETALLQPDFNPGPSPRARGIRRPYVECGGEIGSIPASAGNPTRHLNNYYAAGVHPRERGESVFEPHGLSGDWGPSPRARGIPSGRNPLSNH